MEVDILKKRIIITLFAFVLFVTAITTVFFVDMHRMKTNRPVVFSTWGRNYEPPIENYSAIMCSAKSFYNSKDGAYLEVIFDNEKHTVKKLIVKDEELIKKLSAINLEEIIGVNVKAVISVDVLGEKAHRYKGDIISLLTDYDEYDKYFEITDISL